MIPVIEAWDKSLSDHDTALSTESNRREIRFLKLDDARLLIIGKQQANATAVQLPTTVRRGDQLAKRLRRTVTK